MQNETDGVDRLPGELLERQALVHAGIDRKVRGDVDEGFRTGLLDVEPRQLGAGTEHAAWRPPSHSPEDAIDRLAQVVRHRSGTGTTGWMARCRSVRDSSSSTQRT